MYLRFFFCTPSRLLSHFLDIIFLYLEFQGIRYTSEKNYVYFSEINELNIQVCLLWTYHYNFVKIWCRRWVWLLNFMILCCFLKMNDIKYPVTFVSFFYTNIGIMKILINGIRTTTYYIASVTLEDSVRNIFNVKKYKRLEATEKCSYFLKEFYLLYLIWFSNQFVDWPASLNSYYVITLHSLKKAPA